MDKLDTMLERLANGPGLTRYECLRLVMLAQGAQDGEGRSIAVRMRPNVEVTG